MTTRQNIVAIHRQGQVTPVRPPRSATQCSTAFERQQAEQRLRQLQAMCVLSPELERNLHTARRHHRRGSYSRDVLIRDIERYTVEPAAIDLSAAQPGSSQPWFRVYPQSLRLELATRLALALEQQLTAGMDSEG